LGIRETLDEKPWIGWAVVGVLALVGVWFIARNFVAPDPANVLAQDIVLRYEDTGDEQTVNRGQFQTLLIQLANKGELKVDEGMTNPKTGKKTGFPVDRAYWNKIVPQIIEASAAHKAGRSGGR